MKRFIQREYFDPCTRAWQYEDGSGKILDEARIEMNIVAAETGSINVIEFLGIKERYKR